MSEIFISHRSADAVAAEKLANDIQKAGHHVWLDEWTIDIGDSIVKRMEEGLVGAAYLILCYSDAGVMTPWISREWMSTLARQMEGQDIRILPVTLTGRVAPAILSDIRSADLRTDWNRGLTLLLRSIK